MVRRPDPLRLTLSPDEGAPARARAAVRALPAELPAALLTDLELVVSELVTNALMHGPGQPIELRLEVVAAGRVRGHVADGGDREVRLRARIDHKGGLGLRLVDAVAEWGVRRPTLVWFELPRRG
jgi:anti-sigma regulatory factor (Ser/Thr protein kinase)